MRTQSENGNLAFLQALEFALQGGGLYQHVPPQHADNRQLIDQLANEDQVAYVGLQARMPGPVAT